MQPPTLPVGVAAFVGREGERAKVADLVADARVVTLTGPGGCGKTRLAVEVARDVAARFAGAGWVDLQGVSDPGLVAAAVAVALDVRERPDQALTTTLAERLREQRVLLILDNCEHLVAACAELVDALASTCPYLHVLVTSRVPLRVEGETTFEVPPLAPTDAARLFEVRARQVAAEFRIGDDNADAVATICRQLDGLPLAIELAAARVRVLAPAQIAAGLSDRFALLTTGRRGAPARQQTLEASLDWSYDLLDAAQRLTLARLSMFAGSFELDAGTEVVRGDGIDGDEVLDLIAALVERSLLHVVRQHDRARYRMLETIRVYARARLAELDEPGRLRDRHLTFYVHLAARAQAGLNGAEPMSWVSRLVADLDDLRAAMDWATEAGYLGALVDMTEPIVRFWFERGLSREVHRRLHTVPHAHGSHDGDNRLRALMTAAALALSDNAPADAYRSADEAVAAARALDAHRQLALALGQRAFSGVLSGLSTSAQVAADVAEATQLAEHLEDPSSHAFLLSFTGAALSHGSSIDAGCRVLEQVVELCERHDLAFQLPAGHATLGGGIGPGRGWAGRVDESREHARRAVEFSRNVGRPGWEASGLTGLAAAAVLTGEHDAAGDWLAQAEAALRSRALEGSQYDLGFRQWVALARYASGDLDAARAASAELLPVSRRAGNCWHEAIAEWLLGVLARADGRDTEARAHLAASRALSSDPRLSWPLGRALLGLSDLATTDDAEDAWTLAHEGLEVLDDYGDNVGAAAALEAIAELATALGEPERALRLLAASDRFHAESGVVRFPLEAARFERARTAAQAAVDPTEAAACWEAGAAVPLADAVAYARRGRGERQRPQFGWAALTPVERDVVRLVAQGHTNAEIGERLFISVNTVKKHLIHVYAKLDVDGRAGLAAEVARRDV